MSYKRIIQRGHFQPKFAGARTAWAGKQHSSNIYVFFLKKIKVNCFSIEMKCFFNWNNFFSIELNFLNRNNVCYCC